MVALIPACLAVAGLVSQASAHAAFWHKSMYGFNVTDKSFSYDNRPQVPLYGMTKSQWWMHGHIDYPPKPGDFFELPAGGKVNTELSCDKGATSWYNSSQGGDVGFGSNSACVGAPSSAIHATDINDVTGSALAIAYQPDVHALKPEDLVVFSVNYTSPWYLNTEFEVPNLPACPEEGCHCAWLWIHSYKSGSEQMYMNGFKCKVTGNVGTKPLGKPILARRCGDDPDHGIPHGTPGNCTIGAKSPLYWYQKDNNNMFEGQYAPPYYNGLYGFPNGAQRDIFDDGVIASLTQISGSVPATTHVSNPLSTSQPPTITSVSVSSSPTTTTIASSSPPATTSAPSSPTTSPTSVDSPQASKPTTVDNPQTSKPTTVNSSESTSVSTTNSSGSASTSQCKRKSKRDANAKRNHSRHLSGLHH